MHTTSNEPSWIGIKESQKMRLSKNITYRGDKGFNEDAQKMKEEIP